MNSVLIALTVVALVSIFPLVSILKGCRLSTVRRMGELYTYLGACIGAWVLWESNRWDDAWFIIGMVGGYTCFIGAGFWYWVYVLEHSKTKSKDQSKGNHFNG